MEGELEEELVFTITAVGAAVVRLIHPGLLRWVRAPAPPSKVHIATTHSCFLGPVRHLTWQLGRAGPSCSFPSILLGLVSNPEAQARSTEGQGRLWACQEDLTHTISPPLRRARHAQIHGRKQRQLGGLPACSTCPGMLRTMSQHGTVSSPRPVHTCAQIQHRHNVHEKAGQSSFSPRLSGLPSCLIWASSLIFGPQFFICKTRKALRILRRTK